MRPSHSALLVVVPEAEPVVGTWRRELDPAATWGVPAHITLLYPFVAPARIDAATIDRVQDVLDQHGPAPLALVEVRWFDDDDDVVVWLAPDDPAPLVELTRALEAAFPDHPRYGGEFDDVVPHLTIGHGRRGRLAEAAADVTRRLPIESSLHEVALMVGDREPDTWSLVHRFPLGGAPAPGVSRR